MPNGTHATARGFTHQTHTKRFCLSTYTTWHLARLITTYALPIQHVQRGRTTSIQLYGFSSHQRLYGWTHVVHFSCGWITVQMAEACTVAGLARLRQSVYQRRLQLMK